MPHKKKHYREPEFLKQIGERIRQLRKQAGLTQVDLAVRIELPTSQIGRMERGESNFSVSYLVPLAKTLGVKPSEILEVE